MQAENVFGCFDIKALGVHFLCLLFSMFNFFFFFFFRETETGLRDFERRICGGVSVWKVCEMLVTVSVIAAELRATRTRQDKTRQHRYAF